MPNVLIRDVPGDDLDQIRSAAAERGISLQNYLRGAVLAQAAYLRRQEALVRTAERLGVGLRRRPMSGKRYSIPSPTCTARGPAS
jgi:hypothetical protein